MEVTLIIVFVVFAVLISILQVKYHKRKIVARVHSMGGEVISIERKSFLAGPFSMVRRGQSIYRIKYKIKTDVKEGWVMFGDLSGPDWRL